MTSGDVEPRSRSGERACTLTAATVADLVGGELSGSGDVLVSGVAPLERAGPADLTFLMKARYTPDVEKSAAGVVLVTPELADEVKRMPARIVVRNPQEALLAVLPRLYPPQKKLAAIHPTASIGRGVVLGRDVSLDEYVVIADGATIGDGVWIGAQSYVGRGVTIGGDSRLFSHVTLYSGAVLGSRVVLHSGVRIASDGFGYVPGAREHVKIPHVGRCVIGDDVEIGANTTIDRGSIDDTVVGAGTKIDNLVQIAHNVRIGRLCLILSQVGIAGSATLEDGCIIAGQAGLAGHITIGRGARIAGQAGVFGDVPAGESWSGYPARPHREALRASAAVLKLAGMMRKLERLLEERNGR